LGQLLFSDVSVVKKAAVWGSGWALVLNPEVLSALYKQLPRDFMVSDISPGRVLPIMAYTGRLRKGYLFQASGI